MYIIVCNFTIFVLVASPSNSETIDFIACIFCVFSLRLDQFTVYAVRLFVFLFHIHTDSILHSRRPVVVRTHSGSIPETQNHHHPCPGN